MSALWKTLLGALAVSPGLLVSNPAGLIGAQPGVDGSLMASCAAITQLCFSAVKRVCFFIFSGCGALCEVWGRGLGVQGLRACRAAIGDDASRMATARVWGVASARARSSAGEWAGGWFGGG